MNTASQFALFVKHQLQSVMPWLITTTERDLSVERFVEIVTDLKVKPTISVFAVNDPTRYMDGMCVFLSTGDTTKQTGQEFITHFIEQMTKSE